MRTSRRCSSSLVSLLLLACLAAPAWAAWPHDPNLNVRVTTAPTSASEYSPVAVADGAGGAFLGWFEARSSANYQVFVAHLKVDGTLAAGWPATGIALATSPGNQFSIQLVADGTGGVYAVWLDDRTNTGQKDVYAQHLTSAGAISPGWPVNGIGVSTSLDDENYPHAVSDGANGAYVMWTLHYGTNDEDAYIARLVPGGIAGVPVGVSTSYQLETGHALATDPSGNVYALFGYDSLGTNLYTLRVQKFNSSLSAGYGPAAIVANDSPNPTIHAAMVMDGAGRLIVADHFGTFLSEQLNLYTVDVNGPVPTAAGFDVIGPLAAGYADCDMVGDPSGGAFLAYHPGVHAYVGAYRNDANPRYGWPNIGHDITDGVTTPVEDIRLLPDGSGGVLVVWNDGYDVLGGRLLQNNTSAPGWNASHTPISIASGEKSIAGVVPDLSGGEIAVWEDDRRSFGRFEMFAQRVDRFGALGDPSPHLVSIKDVPADQGGAVKLTWSASYLDSGVTRQVGSYWIWREVPTALALAATAHGARWADDGAAITLTPRGAATATLYRHAEGAAAAAFAWEYVGSQPANTFPLYSFVANTLVDSLPGLNRYTRFMVEARDTGGLAFWDSAPDSGYSVDNLPPATPTPFTANYHSGVTALSWGPDHDADLAGYRLYRGASSSFTPGPGNLVADLTNVSYSDVAPTGSWYKLAAYDSHGNLSGFAVLGPSGITAVEGTSLPTVLSLTLTGASPARGPVGLRLALPHPAQARLEVYDASGRRVRTLADQGLGAGVHDVTWDTRDEAGHALASGLYFARFAAEGRTFVRRIALVR